jgi:hypothetical protein
MTTPNIIKREYISKTLSEKDEGTYWKVISTIYDRVLYEGREDWVEEKVEVMSYDTDLKSAVETSMTGALSYMIETVYKAGFDGLVEYREFERASKAAKEKPVILN